MKDFGPLPVDVPTLASYLIDRAWKIAEKPSRNGENTTKKWRAPYNAAIRTLLWNFGKRKLGLQPICSLRDGRDRCSEWLYDVIWWEKNVGVRLAAEIELGSPQEVADDFKKLLAVKCALKLMVCAAKPQKRFERIKTLLEEHLRSYEHHVGGEVYVVWALGSDAVWSCKISSSGRLDTKGRGLFEPVPLN